MGITFLSLLPFNGYTQVRLSVYDGREEDPDTDTPSNPDVQLIKRYALPKARSAWRSDRYCTERFDAIGVTNGSFTKNNSAQRAVLYRFCSKGHDIANNGIVIIEKGKIVAHIIYHGGNDYSIQTLPDINGDGLSDIVIGDGSTHMGHAEAIAIPISVSSAGIKNHGIADVYKDDCGIDPENCKTLAYKITVKPGVTPLFYRETYRKKNDSWTRVGAAVRYYLRINTGVFRLLK